MQQQMQKKALIVLSTSSVIVFIFLLYIFLSDDDQSGSGDVPLEKKAIARYSLAQMRQFAFKNAMDNEFKHPIMHDQQRILSSNDIIGNPIKNRFQIDGDDVIVFLHMQKTAGTSFENFLVRHLNVTHPCPCDCDLGRGKKKCRCRNANGNIWVFSRYSTGWACGLHADYSELIVSGCVGHKLDIKEGKHHKRRLYLTTFLRDPVERFVSEFSHVSERGATWAGSRHVCGGRPPTPDELPMCFDPELGWKGVDLDEFLACPYNLGFNRQTRMLADLTLVNCYNTSLMNKTERARIMLESAKRTLRQSAFFGLKERMAESQFIFEQTFGLRFDKNLAEWNRSKSAHITPTAPQLELIRRKNTLDLALYEFAVRLFDRRLAQLGWRTTNNSSANNKSRH